MRRNWRPALILIVIVTGLLAWALLTPRIDLPGLGSDEKGKPNRFVRDGFHLGLDLQGGTYLVLEADLTKIGPGENPDDAVKGAMDIIQRRVNAYGVSEAVVQRQPGGNRIIVQLPGVKNLDEALQLIGKTAQLEFREQELDAQGNPARDEQGKIKWKPAMAKDDQGNDVALTGKFLKRNSQVALQGQMGQPIVEFEWDSEGGRLFEQVTGRLIGKPLGIFLDNLLISAPTVRAVIKERGIIEGVPLGEAQLLAIQLNAGALPVPLGSWKDGVFRPGQPATQTEINAILGEDSLHRSLTAGIIGLAAVALFMLLYYRLPGFVAILALLVYGVVLLSIFKLWPVTLSLAGIAGFILSLGMAVDANVLIFERMKEELRGGRTPRASVAVGFRRAWPAIRDSNITTIISTVILIWFGSRFGAPQVTGFAITLLIGVLVSMLTAIVVSRAFLQAFLATGLSKKATMLGV